MLIYISTYHVEQQIMSKKRVAYTLIAMLIAFILLAFTNQHSRWLILNGLSAAKLSKQMLSQPQASTPDWAIDLVINASPKGEMVSFSSHQSEFSYVYSPKKLPSYSGYTWQHLVGAWYVGKIKN